jgi:bifunctional hydroxylase/dehydrase
VTTPHPAQTFADTVEVLIVGAGPTGLMLAAELALAGTEPVLIDALERPTGQSRALGFTVRTLEIFQQRGILDRFDGLHRQPDVHFAGLRIDGAHLSSPLRPANQYPQSKTEAALTTWAGDLGVQVHRPWRLDSIERVGGRHRCVLQGPDGPKVVWARFVAACDGSRSRVRENIAMPTVRTEPSVQMLLADLRGSGLADQPFGVKHRSGMVMSAPLGDGTERVIVCDFSLPFLPTGVPVTHDDVRRAYQNVVGQPLEKGECLWASSFTDASALVECYRSGGVFLVGDSAHTHLPAGGQGMNVSIQDAVNLGWKLAAVSQGRAPDALLDTYHDERRPVAEQLLRNTAAQGQLFLRGPEVDPLRAVLADLLTVPAVAGRLGDSVSGLDVHYPMASAGSSPLVGSRLAPGLLRTTPGGDEAVEQLRHGRAVLFCLAPLGDPALIDEADRWKPHLGVVAATVQAPGSSHDLAGARAVLVRPDGHIAWVGSDPPALRAGLTTWLGTPSTELKEV